MKPLTGRKVFAITVSAFAVIIGVNLVLAFKAVGTFPGLEVKNSYVASQEFNARKAAQLSLGWDVAATYDGDAVIMTITNKMGDPIEAKSVTGILGRATMAADDVTPEFVWDGTQYRFPIALGKGNWNLRLKAVAKNGTAFEQRIPIYVKG
ncbi:MAG: FixH family protein [Halocynthiibacter sp.]